MKLQPKKAKLEKNYTHVDNRKAEKVTREDYREYLKHFHTQKHSCIVCGKQPAEAHHVIPQDNRTIVPICAWHHRGFGVAPEGEGGFFLHRGMRSKEFREAYPDEYMLQRAREFYNEYAASQAE